jgi:hypothetical protein
MGRIALDKTITDEFVNKLATQQQVYKMVRTYLIQRKKIQKTWRNWPRI